MLIIVKFRLPLILFFCICRENKLDVYCLKDSLICLKEFLLHRTKFISLKSGKRKMYYDYTKIMNTLRANPIICHILNDQGMGNQAL